MNSSPVFALAIALASVLAPAGLAQKRETTRQEHSWKFTEDFRHGIPGWMSYPLAQDVGYDPTLSTETVAGSPALVRDVEDLGQERLRVGILRQLSFRADAASRFRLSYSIQACGIIRHASFTLAATDGRRFTAALSVQPGSHDVQLAGGDLHFPSAGMAVEAIVLEFDVDHPARVSHVRLVLSRFEVEAERADKKILSAPALVSSRVDPIEVARGVVDAQHPLTVRFAGASSARIDLYRGDGTLAKTDLIPAGRNVPVLYAGPDTPAGLWIAKVTEPGAGPQSFRFLVVGPVVAHPRVLLSESRIERLRSQPGGEELLKVVHQNAQELRARIQEDAAAGFNIPLMSPASVFPGLPEYFSLLEQYSNAIVFNALDSAFASHPRSFAAARQGLLTVAEWPSWSPPWFAAHGLHTYYEVGVFSQRLALAYDLIAGRLDAADRQRIADGFWRNAIEPTAEEYFASDRMPIAASNWMANSVGGAIALCVALYGDVPGWNSRYGLALAELITAYERLLNGLFPGDGSEAEPAGYEDFAMEGMSWGASALAAMGIRPAGMERMTEAFWWPRYAEYRPGLFLDTGDFGGALQALSGFAWSAENSSDPAAEAFYATAASRTLFDFPHLRHTGRALESAPGLLDLVCCTKSLAKVPEPVPSRVFPLRGSAALRSGWTPDDTVISIRVGPWFNHEHHDQGNFLVAAFGEELIGEGGYADYYKDPRYGDYFSQAPAHNTVLLDDNPFSQGDYDGRYWKAFQSHPSFRRHLFSDEIDYLSANLGPAYKQRLSRYVREYLFLKPDLLIIRDQLRSTVPHRFSWLLHAASGAAVTAAGTQARIEGADARALITVVAPAASWQTQQDPIPFNAYDQFMSARIPPRQVLRLDSPAEQNAGFLVGIRLERKSGAPVPLTPIHSSSGEGFALPGGEGIALFRIAPGPIETARFHWRDFSTDGDVLLARETGGEVILFSAGAREFRQKGRILLSSTAPLDATLRMGASLVRLSIACEQATNLRLSSERPPAQVSVDGRSVEGAYAAGFLSLPHLSPGEHHVRVAYP